MGWGWRGECVFIFLCHKGHSPAPFPPYSVLGVPLSIPEKKIPKVAPLDFFWEEHKYGMCHASPVARNWNWEIPNFKHDFLTCASKGTFHCECGKEKLGPTDISRIEFVSFFLSWYASSSSPPPFCKPHLPVLSPRNKRRREKRTILDRQRVRGGEKERRGGKKEEEGFL